MKKLFVLLSVFFSLTTQMAFGVFNNNGTIRSQDSKFTADVLNNNGTFEGIDSVWLKCDKLTGNGLIKGPKIKILADECEYEGEINCSVECLLVTNTPTKNLKFNFVGEGNLIIRRNEE